MHGYMEGTKWTWVNLYDKYVTQRFRTSGQIDITEFSETKFAIVNYDW